MKEVIKYAAQAIYYIVLLVCFLFGTPLLKVIAVILIAAEIMLKFVQKLVDCIWSIVNKRK
ncbi:hypothetical protein [Robinsoniella peoriensis]